MTHEVLLARIRRLPSSYQQVLRGIAAGQDTGHAPMALVYLWTHGLLERQEVTPATPAGALPVIRYTLPPAVWAAWEAWQASRAAGAGGA